MLRWIAIAFLLSTTCLSAQVDNNDFVLITDTAPTGGFAAPQDTGSTFISNDVDSAFRQAREYAYDREYDKATPILNFYIKQYPEYYDLRTFLARTKLWQKDYQAADNILRSVLEDNPSEINAYRVLTLSQQYRGNHDSAIAIANQGLKKDSADPALLLHKAQSQTAIREYKEGLNSVSRSLENDSANREGKKLKTFLLNQLINDGIGVGYGIDFFDENFEQGSVLWHNGLVQLGTFTKAGMLIGRVNWRAREGQSGTQGEVEFYPILGKKTYLFLNAAYSQSELYPNVNLSAELYHRITSSLEASAGIRYQFFGRQPISTFEGLDTVDRVALTTLTASLGYYFGDNYLLGRINTQYNNQLFTWGTSGQLLYRNFLNGSASFVQLSAIYGFLPDLRLIELGNNLAIFRYNRQNISLQAAYQQLLDDHWFVRLSFSLTFRENRIDPRTNEIDFFRIYSPFILLGYRF